MLLVHDASGRQHAQVQFVLHRPELGVVWRLDLVAVSRHFAMCKNRPLPADAALRQPRHRLDDHVSLSPQPRWHAAPPAHQHDCAAAPSLGAARARPRARRYHAVMAARKFGGVAEDYLLLETWMDFTKSHIVDCRHRLFLHNAWGLFVAERIHGATVTRASDGKTLPLRPLLEDHILQDFGKIPTLAQRLAQLAPEP